MSLAESNARSDFPRVIILHADAKKAGFATDLGRSLANAADPAAVQLYLSILQDGQGIWGPWVVSLSHLLCNATFASDSTVVFGSCT